MSNHIRFIVGSQHLYGPAALAEVSANAQAVCAGLNDSGRLPITMQCMPICTTADESLAACRSASADADCIGVVVWMHTFSPAKMWLSALQALSKPLLHLHTQMYAEIPWSTIDMDFMNLHQAAHGDREFGHGATRVGIRRRVVVGHWQSQRVQDEIAQWQRAANGVAAFAQTKVARFGDNMRNVAVTDGDKVAAQLRFGLQVDGYGVGDLVDSIAAVHDDQVQAILADIEQQCELIPELSANGKRRASLITEARIEAGIKNFLDAGGYTAYTNTFEDLHGLAQLPGLASQRLMAQGYGFGAEGDWKTSALLRVCKVMGKGLSGGASFMEDYTYDLREGQMQVLGAHMLEVCPSICAQRPRIELHPLGIGGKDDPVRAVFTAAAGPAVNASLIDMGDRFRLILSTVNALTPAHELPHLPVARALWQPLPDLATAAAAWLQAGGAHHTVFTQALSAADLECFAEILDLECLVIDQDTTMRGFMRELRSLG